MLLQVNLQAAKTNFERELAAKEEAAEEARRSLIKQLRELEGQVEEERKARAMAQSAAKKIESEVAELESQIEAESKGREDALRMYKKTQVSASLNALDIPLDWSATLFGVPVHSSLFIPGKPQS